jgi:hypothetical protein
MHTGTLLSLVGAALYATGTFMYFLSEHFGGLLKQHAILNGFCWTALFMEVFGMLFLLIGSIFLALKVQPVISFSTAVGLLVAFGVVSLLGKYILDTQ